MDGSFRVLVAGGGVAGLEAVLALHDLAGDRIALTLLSPERDFVFRPMAVAQPFSRGHAVRHPLTAVARHAGAELIRGRLVEVDGGHAVTEAGERLPYDALLIAVGARSEPALRHALTWTPETDAEVFGGLLRDVEEGYAKRVAFVVPDVVAWPLPAYELALMTAWEASGMGQTDVDVAVYTPEDAPLGLFGAAASEALRSELAEVGVRVVTGAHVRDGEPGLVVGPGEQLDAQRAVALPRAAGPALRGVPSDDRGFIPADRHGKVADAVWVAGDALAYPVKQGGLAAQEADAAAQAIAAAAGADVDPQPFRPVLRGVLLTGRGRQWMRQALETADGPGDTARHALWWPPTKVAGRYLSPYLGAIEDAEVLGSPARPDGQPVELDLDRRP
jgi:sulfide:quinone oxidoreductase